jgi:hypothetical protein
MKAIAVAGLAMGMVLVLAVAVGLGLTGTGTPVADAPQAAREMLRSNAKLACSVEASPRVPAVVISLLAMIEAVTDPENGSDVIQRAADSVPDSHLCLALNALVRSTNAAAPELCKVLTRRWAETDLSTAVLWAEHFSGQAFQSEALRQVAIVWANRDLKAAADWIAAMPDECDKEAARISVGYEACRTQPLVALQLAIESAPGPDRDGLLVHAISQWADADSRAAWEWASRVPDSCLRDHLLAAVAVAAAEQDGASAAGLVASSLPTGPQQERAAVAVAQRWARKSPREAASWVVRFPDSVRASAVQNVVTLWTDQDSEAAAAWVQQLPEDSRRDFGLTGAGHPAGAP